MDKVQLLVIALRAEAEWLGLSVHDYNEAVRNGSADRMEKVVNAVLEACAEDLRHIGDVEPWGLSRAVLYQAANRLEELSD
jgi:hypothetical protein